MSKPKRHHYLSQFYLAGFTSNGKKNGDIYCFNIIKRKVRKSKVKEEGHEKHFNRIESDVFDESSLENELSKFESDAAQVFGKIKKYKSLPSSPEDWGVLFYYLALLGVRNPAIRQSIDDFKSSIFKTVLQFYLADNLTWDKYKNGLEEEEFKELKKLPFLEARKILLDPELKIVSPPSEHTRVEFPIIDKITKLLSYRKWSLVDATKSKYDIITSDRPVKLFWDDKELGKLNFGPGFGMKSSVLLFPLSKKIFLLGSHEREFPPIIATDEMVATINSMQFYFSNRFLYGAQDFFYFDSKFKDNVSSKKYFKKKHY